jgi:hypothetical protein
MDYGILYSGFPTILKGYNDAYWISYSYDNKSTSSYIYIFFNQMLEIL